MVDFGLDLVGESVTGKWGQPGWLRFRGPSWDDTLNVVAGQASLNLHLFKRDQVGWCPGFMPQFGAAKRDWLGKKSVPHSISHAAADSLGERQATTTDLSGAITPGNQVSRLGRYS